MSGSLDKIRNEITLKHKKEDEDFLKEHEEASRSANPLDLLRKKNYTTKEEASRRMDLCLECPSLIKFSRQCKECGCFMNLKTKLTTASCPAGKW